MYFSTKDKDLDYWTSHCAVVCHGAWWYYACHTSNLNGRYYHNNGPGDDTGMEWHRWKLYKIRRRIKEHWKNDYSMKRTTMKVRPN